MTDAAGALDFATVYRANLDYVWASVRRLGIPSSDLEDVAHEVFLVVHRKLDQYDRARPLRPWLFGIAYRIASEHRRKNARRAQQELEDELAASESSSSPEKQTVKRQAIELAQKALDAIDEEARAVFVLAELDGVAVTDVAETLSIPVNTAYTRLRRARLAIANAITQTRGGAA
ncbi:MAG: RNA polymerase sigma factor [Kofleriaceae bacterium]